MSYILAALKKAESERREQADDVGLSSVVESSLEAEGQSASSLKFFAVVVVLAALAIWLWLASSTDSKEQIAAETPSAATDLPASVPAVGIANGLKAESMRATVGPKPTVLEASVSRFDSIELKGHLYVATRPSLRKVVINNSTLREGEVVNGISIKEITETGVIVSFNGVEKTISAY
jgi:type II secretory pathway component PulC